MKAEKRNNLVLLIPGFPADESDSTCLPAQQAFLLALKENYPSVNLTVVSFQYPYRSGTYQWNGIPVYALNRGNKGGIFRIITWIRAWRVLKQLNRNEQLTGLLSFWCGECALVGKWFAKYNQLKHYCWILGQDAKKENRLVKFINPKSTELIALSDFLRDQFHKNHHVKPFQVIPNAIDPQRFPPLPQKRKLDLIGVGSLIPLKQFDVFISVLEKAVEFFPDLQAVICGQGPELGSLQTLIKNAGLEKNLQLVGEKPHGEVLKLLQQSKILLHPSSYEGYSSVCLEALYAGAHVISFQKPDDNIIEHWHGANTIEEMQKKVLEILSDPIIDHNRVLLHTVEESAEKIVNLFEVNHDTLVSNVKVEG